MISQEQISNTILNNLPELTEFFNDRLVTEISVNPGGAVFVEKEGVITQTALVINEKIIQIVLSAVAAARNKDVIEGQESSIVNGTFNSMRFAGALKPVSPDGSFFTVRKHLPPELRPSLDQLIEWEALTHEDAQFITENFINKNPASNLIIVGATGSGKTTYANAFLKKIPHHQRVVTIEEVEELQCQVPNLLRLLVNEQAKITARTLVQATLRFRPDRVIIGESRGDETFDVIRLFNTGHAGSLTTIHASSAKLGLDVIEMMYQMSLPDNAQIPTDVVRQYIAGAVQLILYVDRSYQLLSDGTQKSIRTVKEIVKVEGVKNGNYVLEYFKGGPKNED